MFWFRNFIIRHINFFSDIGNGLWAGFPICCILNYAFHHYRELSLSQYPFDPIPFPGYVRCKKCIEKGKIVVNARSGCLFKVFYIGKVVVLDESDFN